MLSAGIPGIRFVQLFIGISRLSPDVERQAHSKAKVGFKLTAVPAPAGFSLALGEEKEDSDHGSAR